MELDDEHRHDDFTMQCMGSHFVSGVTLHRVLLHFLIENLAIVQKV